MNGCFNSRTREGCDQLKIEGDVYTWGFNSRTREGCDGSALAWLKTNEPVSIHAPARGATLCSTACRPTRSFNSRTREGYDARVPLITSFVLSFQFTHPRGVRLSRLSARSLPAGFNSRTREGCDNLRKLYLHLRPLVSIHAPARGATAKRKSMNIDAKNVSIHAPARGATSHTCGDFFYYQSFNSRTREGCDPSTCVETASALMFQFTYPRGVRPAKIDRKATRLRVSIHAPARGATNLRLCSTR